MVTVECKKCAGIWIVQDDAMQQLEVCPFCSAPLREGHEGLSGTPEQHTLGKVLYDAYAADKDVLQSARKLGSALHRLGDTPLQKQIRLFIWHIGVDYMDELRAAFEQSPEGLDPILQSLRESLLEKDGFSQETADTLVDAVREAVTYAEDSDAADVVMNDHGGEEMVTDDHAAAEDACAQSGCTDKSAAQDNGGHSDVAQNREAQDSASEDDTENHSAEQMSDTEDEPGPGRLTGIEILEITPDTSILHKMPEPETEVEKELDECIKAAEQGSAQAVYKLAAFYRDGRGVKRNMNRAVGWYRRAAELGLPEAQNALGDCYRMGLGVPQDMEEAAKWYFRAAEQGSAEAENNLGDLYRAGLPLDDMKQALFTKLMEYTDPDNKYGANVFEAVLWYRKAAEQGLAVAQNNMGDCYRFGMGVKQDPLQAAQWYRKAAEQGMAKAQENLKECYWD